MSSNSISIVISIYNRSPDIVEIVEKLLFPSLLQNAAGKQLILVDDNSPEHDHTEKILRSFEEEAKTKFNDLKIIRRPENLGFAGSYNDAAARADGDILLISNADVYFPVGSIDTLALHAATKDAQVGPVTNAGYGYQTTDYFKAWIGGKHLTDFSLEEKQKLEQVTQALLQGMGGQIYPISHSSVSGFCFAIPKTAVSDQEGIFDPQFKTFWNDTDLSRRMNEQAKAAGKEAGVYVDGSTFIYHHDKNSISNQVFKVSISAFDVLFLRFIPDAIRYMKKWNDYVGTTVDFAQRTVQNMFYIGTITKELEKNIGPK